MNARNAHPVTAPPIARTRTRSGASVREACRAALLIALALAWWSDAGLRAAIHVCAAADGGTVFQDRPCASADGGPTAGAAARQPRPPAGMHPSWFERPPGTRVRARCDDRGCACGTRSRPFDGGLELAVADALYLDGAWHRYERGLVAATNVEGDPGTRDAERDRRVVREALCDVLMSQQTLRRHADRVLGTLRTRARAAEARGFDEPTACDAGDVQACDHHDAYTLYRRMIGDVGTLRRSRDEFSAGAAEAALPGVGTP